MVSHQLFPFFLTSDRPLSSFAHLFAANEPEVSETHSYPEFSQLPSPSESVVHMLPLSIDRKDNITVIDHAEAIRPGKEVRFHSEKERSEAAIRINAEHPLLAGWTLMPSQLKCVGNITCISHNTPPAFLNRS